MTRGNQRDVDRQRAQKKQEEKIRAAGRVSFLFTITFVLYNSNYSNLIRAILTE